jgi:hypothetical protein
LPDKNGWPISLLLIGKVPTKLPLTHPFLEK